MEDLLINPPRQVQWTKEKFNKCSYYELSCFFVNWHIAIDDDCTEVFNEQLIKEHPFLSTNKRKIAIYFNENCGDIFTELLTVTHADLVYSSAEMQMVIIEHSEKAIKWLHKYFGYAFFIIENDVEKDTKFYIDYDHENEEEILLTEKL